MMNLNYKYRMYPTPSQEQKLIQVIGSCRYVWNHFLALEIEQYKANKTFRFGAKNSKDLPELKKQEDTQWLKEMPAVALQQTVRSLDMALKQSFKSKTNRKGFPKFKSKKHWQGGFPLVTQRATTASQENGTFNVPNVGRVKTKYHRAIPSEFTTCNIKYETGKWYLVLTVKVRKQPKSSGKSSVGIDINSLEYVTSDGEVIPIPRFLGENQAQIKRTQRRLARKKKGSSNRVKWQLRLARQHHKIKCQRLDFFHKLSSYLVDNYDIICLEDLNVKAIQKFNGHVIKDNSFAEFRQLVEYKAEMYGKQVIIIDRYYASTKTCSNCGNVQSIALSERTYKCNCCGIEISRDYNASVNINRAGSARIYACGDRGSTIDSSELVATLVGEAGSPDR